MLKVNATAALEKIKVPEELYKRFNNFVGKDFNKRYSFGDSDKELEKDLCKVYFKSAEDFLEPVDWSEEQAEIDIWVNEEPIQIKGRNQKNFLVLEDYKLTKDGQKTSWLDRCIAKYILFVYPLPAPTLGFRLYDSRDLQRLLRILRETEKDNKQQINEIDVKWANRYFPNWIYAKGKIKNSGTETECKLFEILL